MSSRKKKLPKVRVFVETCLTEGITSPSKMRDIYNENFPRKIKGELRPLTSDAFTKALRRLGISSEERIGLKRKAQEEKELKDIMDYDEVKNYLHYSKYVGHVSKAQIENTMRELRTLFTWMVDEEIPNPKEWNIKNLGKCMEKHIGMKENGQWKRPSRVLTLWGAYNRCFQGRLPKGWSMGLKRPAGELKDFFEYTEYFSFDSALKDTENMSLEGWKSLFSAEINMGCRGGTTGNTGITSLSWENINFKTKRCKIRDKGKKGQPARLWIQVPLDLFPWVKGWEKLIRWWEQQGKPTQGKVFTVNYDQYRLQFHRTRKRVGGRISQNLETLRPHIMRKTHAQWAKRMGVTLDNLCGDTTASPNVGRYGVGWDDPKVPMKYYLTKEPWEYEEQDKIIEKRLAIMQIAVIPQ